MTLTVYRYKYKDVFCAQVYRDRKPIWTGECFAIVNNRDEERFERDLGKMLERFENDG